MECQERSFLCIREPKWLSLYSRAPFASYLIFFMDGAMEGLWDGVTNSNVSNNLQRASENLQSANVQIKNILKPSGLLL